MGIYFWLLQLRFRLWQRVLRCDGHSVCPFSGSFSCFRGVSWGRRNFAFPLPHTLLNLLLSDGYPEPHVQLHIHTMTTSDGARIFPLKLPRPSFRVPLSREVSTRIRPYSQALFHVSPDPSPLVLSCVDRLGNAHASTSAGAECCLTSTTSQRLPQWRTVQRTVLLVCVCAAASSIYCDLKQGWVPPIQLSVNVCGWEMKK